MIIPDVNLLVYAADESSPFHGQARGWWEACLHGSEMIGLPWSVILGFVRITTDPRIFVRPLTVEEAGSLVDGWLAAPATAVIEPGPKHWNLLSRLLRQAGVGGRLVPDAHLAALAIEHRALLCTNDRGLARFSGLKVENPLEDRAG
jgi:toxin-antitoxin system PIN domain toxin